MTKNGGNNHEKNVGFLSSGYDGRGDDDLPLRRERSITPGNVIFDQDTDRAASVKLEYNAVTEPTYTITIPQGVQRKGVETRLL